MKKLIAIALCLVIMLASAGCSQEPAEPPELDTSGIIPEDISTITLNANGKTVQITDADKIMEIESIIQNIAFKSAGSDASIEEPGAVSVTVAMDSRNGTQQIITYPYFLWNGYTYTADASSVGSFQKYFD